MSRPPRCPTISAGSSASFQTGGRTCLVRTRRSRIFVLPSALVHPARNRRWQGSCPPGRAWGNGCNASQPSVKARRRHSPAVKRSRSPEGRNDGGEIRSESGRRAPVRWVPTSTVAPTDYGIDPVAGELVAEIYERMGRQAHRSACRHRASTFSANRVSDR